MLDFDSSFTRRWMSGNFYASRSSNNPLIIVIPPVLLSGRRKMLPNSGWIEDRRRGDAEPLGNRVRPPFNRGVAGYARSDNTKSKQAGTHGRLPQASRDVMPHRGGSSPATGYRRNRKFRPDFALSPFDFTVTARLPQTHQITPSLSVFVEWVCDSTTTHRRAERVWTQRYIILIYLRSDNGTKWNHNALFQHQLRGVFDDKTKQ